MKNNLKQSEIVINKFNKNEIAAAHLLLQLNKNEAAIMTTKVNPKDGVKTFELKQSDIIGITIKDKSFVSSTIVENSSGDVIGKIKPSSLNKVMSF